MSRQDELNSYISKLQQRLQLGAWLRGLATLVVTAVLVTVALVLLLNHYAFPTLGITGARFFLILALIAVAGCGIAFPLLRLTRARTVRVAEAKHAALEERLTTFQERQQDRNTNPFIELLAADTLEHTQAVTPSSLIPDTRLFIFGGMGLASLCVLIWMISAGPGYLGYGASALWKGQKRNALPLYAMSVKPGDIAIRRNSDQLITARITGMRPTEAKIFARYQNSSSWEPVRMQEEPNSESGATYRFVLAGVPNDVEYYVSAGPLVSPHYKVRVVDLPSVKAIRVTYRYPKWTGMKSETIEHTGDLRAIEGTDAEIELQMDHPLKNGQLDLDGGKAIHLSPDEGNKYHATIHMDKDGTYHVVTTDEGQAIRLSEDYFIATDKATPPEVAISRPGGDYRASPIEEVTVGVKASDSFGLNSVRLHYTVNGGSDHDIDLLKTSRSKNADGSYVLHLEDFKLAPGDLISLYATAKDGHAEARTDMSFIQVDPFEREFSQSQQSGGSGGSAGGTQNNQMEISRRQKELIAETWKQQNNKTANSKDAVATGKFLSDAQQKLRDQVMALSARMESRDLAEENDEFGNFQKDMQTAAEAMAPSVDQLKGTHWKEAMPLEQKALQALLHAEATFRQIQVAFGQQGGGGGGAGSAGRDLASLFDLELDTAKNQYETAQRASPEDQRQKEIEDALAKLDALAKRQEELANKQHDPQQSFQERWQQEMLRREAEQLQQQMEQLAKSDQGNTSNSQQSSNGTPSSQSSQASKMSRNGRSSGSQKQSGDQNSLENTDERIEQALSRLRQAGETMKRNGSPQQNAETERQAADRLREATNLLGNAQQKLTTDKLGALSLEANRLTQEERAQADQINQFANRTQNSGPMDRETMMNALRERNRLAEERQQLSNDLSNLQRNLRTSAQEMASSQSDISKKLRDALSEMDESDLDNHIQRTADWLRGGINPNSNGTEDQIAQGLQKLGRRLKEAQQQLAQQKPRQGKTASDELATLNQVERLRQQLEAMTASRQRNNNSGDRQSEGNPQGLSRQSQTDRSGQRSNTNSQSNQPNGNSGQQSSSSQPGGQYQSGDVRHGSGNAGGPVLGNINTGNNRYGSARPQQSVPTDASGNSGDSAEMYQRGLRELNALRTMVGNDPQAGKEVRELARQMQQLDPKRFPGNPAIVEQMNRELLGSLDRIELQLQRDHSATEAKTGKPISVPAGYQDATAEYYRRLSRNP